MTAEGLSSSHLLALCCAFDEMPPRAGHAWTVACWSCMNAADPGESCWSYRSRGECLRCPAPGEFLALLPAVAS